MTLKKEGPEEKEIDEIIKVFNFNEEQKIVAKNLIKSLYKIIIEKDANLIEINPLILTEEKRLFV